jgi:excisionase family DNA binding protein
VKQENDVDDKLSYTPQEAAQRLNLSRGTLYRRFLGTDLPTVKVGRSVRIHRLDLERFADRLRANASHDPQP